MTLDSLPDLDTSGLCLVKTLSTALTCWPYRNTALRDGARLAATFPGAGNGMSAMRVLRSASAARVGRVSRPSSVWQPRILPDTANTSVPWKECLQDTTRLYPSPGDCLGS